MALAEQIGFIRAAIDLLDALLLVLTSCCWSCLWAFHYCYSLSLSMSEL